MFDFTAISVSQHSFTIVVVSRTNSSIECERHVRCLSPFSTCLSIAFSCVCSSGASTSSTVCSTWLYFPTISSKLPIWTRYVSAFLNSSAAASGILYRGLPSASTSPIAFCRSRKYLTSRSSLTRSGSKLTASRPAGSDSASRRRSGCLSFDCETSSTPFPHSEYFDDSNSRREARSDAWSFTTSFDSSKSSIGRIVAFSFAIGSSIRSTSPRVQKSAPDTGGMLT